MAILDRFENKRIFCVERTGDDEFNFTENCDGYFSLTLNKEEIRQLIKELRALIKKSYRRRTNGRSKKIHAADETPHPVEEIPLESSGG